MNGVNIEIPHNREVSSESQQSHISSPGDRWNLLTAGLKCLSMGSAVTLTRLSSPLSHYYLCFIRPGLKFLAEMNKKPPA